MRLTPGQIREVLDVPQETFRHWKKALPTLSARNGYRPCFTLGDLVALAVVKGLTDGTGIKIGALAPAAKPLFALCNTTPWVAIERGLIALDVASGTAQVVGDPANITFDTTIVIVPGKQLILGLRDRLLTEHAAEPQAALRFPLQSIAKRAPRRDSSRGAGR